MFEDSDDNPSHVISAEKLIREVKIRPLLYNKYLKDYKSSKLKDQLWNEIFPKIIRNYKNLSLLEQDYRGRQVRKKWKNLKDTFLKELLAQNKWKNCSTANRKRKYVHYDSMSFLVPIMRDKLDGSNVDNSQCVHDDNDETPISPHSHNENINENGESIQQPCKLEKYSEVFTCEDSMINLFNENENDNENEKQYDNKEPEDEDKLFATMLVPMLRKLNDDQKHFAKVEILHIMHRAKRYREE